MDETSGMKKKPSAVSARPAVRAPAGRGAVAPAHAGPPVQAPKPVQVQPAAPDLAGKTPRAARDATVSGPNVKAYIERQLKSVYDDVLNQPIPDRFVDLLNALDKNVGGDKPATKEPA